LFRSVKEGRLPRRFLRPKLFGRVDLDGGVRKDSEAPATSGSRKLATERYPSGEPMSEFSRSVIPGRPALSVPRPRPSTCQGVIR